MRSKWRDKTPLPDTLAIREHMEEFGEIAEIEGWQYAFDALRIAVDTLDGLIMNEDCCCDQCERPRECLEQIKRILEE